MARNSTRKKKARPRKVLHPSYPNPTIREAVCEIHFQHSEKKPWLPSLPGDLFKRLQDDFPHMEPLMNLGIQFEVGPQGLGQRVMPPSPRARFIHTSGTWMVHLAQGQLTINQMKPYPGWESFRSQVVRTWSEAAGVIKPGRILRIGLRYINQIPLGGPAETMGGWLRETGLIPRGLLDSGPDPFSRVQVVPEPGHRQIVMVGTQGTGEPGADRHLFLDVDVIIENSLPPTSKSVESRIEKLHDEIWKVFSEAKGEKLEAYLNREGGPE